MGKHFRSLDLLPHIFDFCHRQNSFHILFLLLYQCVYERFMKFLSIISASFFLVLLFPLSVFAQQNMQSIILPKDQTINHNYFATGNTVDIEGTVNGDVYATGGNVLVNGTINGDVIAAGGQVTIRGIAQNVRIAGGQVIIEGKINGNVTSLGGNISTTDTSSVSGSLVGAGGQFSLLGPIGKTVSLAAGQVTLGNTIGSDVWVSTQNLALTPQAKITGNLTYISAQNATIANGAQVNKRVNHSYPPSPKENERQGQPIGPGIVTALAGLRVGFAIASFIVGLVVGLLLISFAPIYTNRIVEHMTRHPWQALLIGIISWILIPFIFGILLITLIGIPFAILLVIFIFILSYIGKIIATLIIGRWVVGRFDKRGSRILSLIAGLVVIEIIQLIPVLGWLFGIVIGAIGLGATLFMEKIYYTELRTKKII